MSWLIAGGELLVGAVVLVVWWIALQAMNRRNWPMTNFRLSVLAPLMLMWAVAGVILVLRGLTVL